MKTTKRSAVLLLALVIGCATGPSVYAASKTRAVSQALAKKMLARDLARDAVTPAKALPAGRTVQRFTRALCRFVWNLTSHLMGADAGQFRQCGNKR